MTATVQGVECELQTRNPSHGKAVAVLEAPLQYHQAVQDLGPRATTLQLRTWFDGAAMDADARDLVERLLASRFLAVMDPAGIFYEDTDAILVLNSAPVVRNQRLTFVDLPCTYVGNTRTHRFRFVVTSHQLPNPWSQAGRTMVRIPPAFQVEQAALHVADNDAARGVWRDLFFADQDAAYEADAQARSGGYAIPAHLADPAGVLDECVRAVVDGRDWHGPGRSLAGHVVRNVAQDVLFDAANDRLVFTDRLGLAGAAARTMVLDPWTRATHGGSAMPATPQRHTVVLDNGAVVSVQDNGNTYVRPMGGSVTVAGGAARAFGSGVFWHAIGGAAYLVSNVDFAVDAAGVVDYDEDPDAVFGVIHTDLAGAARTDRLREFYAETIVDWLPEAR